MPPIRNMSQVKPIKTERTHEENQERAYIAASRRSDRSLEARVESARRASEIHKRRTGRSLRVTEQDVINEEMYEEEDDDLPLQYRRLTANLQTGSLDFNRKLAAYLTHNVAVRSALNQAINDSFAQQYPGAQQFNQNPMFPSPLSTANFPPVVTQSPQNTPTSPHPHRQAPYPMPGTPGFRAQPSHKRANSSAIPQSMSGTQSYTNTPVDGTAPTNFRRMSMPATTVKPEIKPGVSRQGTSSASSSPGVARKEDLAKPAPTGQMGPPQQQQFQQTMFDFQHPSMSPLTMTLPQDTQQLIGASLPPNDPFSNILLGGNHPNSFFGMNDYSSGATGTDFYQSGINSTLAPNAYNLQDPSLGITSGSTSANNPMSMADFKGVHYADPTSGVNTPGENSFDAWIHDNWTTENT